MVLMMVAMMVPGAIPATARTVGHDRPAGNAVVFLAPYRAIWAMVGAVVFALYRPFAPTVSGSMVMAVGLYELTPVKQHFRRRCRVALHSGLEFAVCCVGSSIGLMLLVVTVNAKSVPWRPVCRLSSSTRRSSGRTRPSTSSSRCWSSPLAC